MKERFGMTMVVVSHDLTSMRAIADFVVVLGEGRSLFAGTVAELDATADPYLRRFLDRKAAFRDTPRITDRPLPASVLKVDCSRHLGSFSGPEAGD